MTDSANTATVGPASNTTKRRLAGENRFPTTTYSSVTGALLLGISATQRSIDVTTTYRRALLVVASIMGDRSVWWV